MTPIDTLQLKTRTRHLLLKARIQTVEELLLRYNDGRMQMLAGMGETTIQEIETALARYSIAPEGPHEDPGAQSFFDDYAEAVARVRLEIKRGRLAGAVICNCIDLDTCISAPVGNIPFPTAIQYKDALDCAIRHVNIYGELAEMLKALKPRDLEILTGRFGAKKVTLEELAEQLHVTRERIRQIEARIDRDIFIAYRSSWLPRSQTAVYLANQLGSGFRYHRWMKDLMRRGLLGRNKMSLRPAPAPGLDTLGLMVSVIELLRRHEAQGYLAFPDGFTNLVERPNISVRAVRNVGRIGKSDRHNIRRFVTVFGAINYESPLIGTETDHRLKKELLGLLGYRDIGDGWYSAKAPRIDGVFPKNYVVLNSALKVLKATSPVPIRDLQEGISNWLSRRHLVFGSRELSAVLSLEIFKNVLLLNGFTADGDLISWPTANPTKLEGRDNVFISLVHDIGPVVTFQEISDAFEAAGLTRSSAVAAMQFSPLIQKLGRGLYKLCGATISPVDYKIAHERRERTPTHSEFQYTMNGEIIFRTTVGSMGMGGVLPIYGLPNLSGTWACFVKNEHVGDVPVNDSFIWRLSTIFRTLGIVLGDRIELRFDIWNKSLYVSKLEDSQNG